MIGFNMGITRAIKVVKECMDKIFYYLKSSSEENTDNPDNKGK